MTRPFAAVLFDAGGTLFTEHPPRHVLYARAARAHGVHVAAGELAGWMAAAHAALPREIDGRFRYTEGWFRIFVQEVFGRARAPLDVERLAQDLICTFRRPETFRLFPEVAAAVRRIRGAGFRLAVVSNWGPGLPAVLAGLGLGGVFEQVIASATVRLEKPDPAIFRRAAALLGVDVTSCLHVGDHPEKDVAGAENAGARAVLVDRHGLHPDQRTRIASLDDLLPRLGLPRLAGA